MVGELPNVPARFTKGSCTSRVRGDGVSTRASHVHSRFMRGLFGKPHQSRNRLLKNRCEPGPIAGGLATAFTCIGFGVKNDIATAIPIPRRWLARNWRCESEPNTQSSDHQPAMS